MGVWVGWVALLLSVTTLCSGMRFVAEWRLLGWGGMRLRPLKGERRFFNKPTSSETIPYFMLNIKCITLARVLSYDHSQD